MSSACIWTKRKIEYTHNKSLNVRMMEVWEGVELACPKDKHMEFNFSKRKPISGTFRITIRNLIRLSSAMAINTFIAFIRIYSLWLLSLSTSSYWEHSFLPLFMTFTRWFAYTYSYYIPTCMWMMLGRLWHEFSSFEYSICWALVPQTENHTNSKESAPLFFIAPWTVYFFLLTVEWTMCYDVERSI